MVMEPIIVLLSIAGAAMILRFLAWILIDDESHDYSHQRVCMDIHCYDDSDHPAHPSSCQCQGRCV